MTESQPQSLYPNITYDFSKLESIRPSNLGIPRNAVKRQFIKLYCYICGKQVIKQKFNLRLFNRETDSYGKIFCGLSCSAKWRRNETRGGRQKRDLHRFCGYCKQKFNRANAPQLSGTQNGELPHSDVAFCSPACRGKYKMENYPEEKRLETKRIESERTKRHQQRIRLQVVSGYGSKCECCGEANHRFLTIDHKNNDGKKERSMPGLRTAYQLYKTLIEQNFPKNRYQLLCFNCNCGKQANGGTCPHQIEKQESLNPLSPN